MRVGDRIVTHDPFIDLHGHVSQSAPTLLFQLDNGDFSSEMGYDHNPYSVNYKGVPNSVADAQREGFGLHLPDIDVRQIEWES